MLAEIIKITLIIIVACIRMHQRQHVSSKSKLLVKKKKKKIHKTKKKYFFNIIFCHNFIFSFSVGM